MSKVAPRISFIILLSVLTVVWAFFPFLISKSNQTLENFIRTPFLGVLGFMISVTVASCSNIHLALNKLEAEGRGPFKKTRQSLKRSSYSLILLFFIAFCVIILKGLEVSSERYDAALNGFCIAILFFYTSVLYDVSRSIFLLPPSGGD